MGVWYNSCRGCTPAGVRGRAPGSGSVAEPGRPCWAFWRRVTCPACGGDGMAKLPGWPDREEMRRRRPKGPLPPPPMPRADAQRVVVELLDMRDLPDAPKGGPVIVGEHNLNFMSPEGQAALAAVILGNRRAAG